MAELPEGLTQKDIDRYAYLDAGIKKLVEEHTLLNDKIKQKHKEAGIKGKKTLSYPSDKFGTVIVTLGEQKRLVLEDLIKAYPVEKAPQFWTMQFDKTLPDATILNKYKTDIVQTLGVKVSE